MARLPARYGRARNDASAVEVARQFHAFGQKGVGLRRQAAAAAPGLAETEWTKASLILAELGDEGERIPL